MHSHSATRRLILHLFLCVWLTTTHSTLGISQDPQPPSLENQSAKPESPDQATGASKSPNENKSSEDDKSSEDFSEQGPLVLQRNDPLEDLTVGVIDNRKIYNNFVNRGRRLIKDDRILTAVEMKELVDRAPTSIDLASIQPNLDSTPKVQSEELHDRLRRASLMVGTLYDCGRCSNLHGNIAGGVVITEDGLALTNHHVLIRQVGEKVQGMIAMNHLGQCFAISEVLAVSKSSDIALIRLASNTKFEPIRIASSTPKPLSNVIVVSHPHNEFYVVTTGLVSRLTKPTMNGDTTTWLEITAEFSGGSSGSGVFNSQGELIGLVSRIHPMFRSEEKQKQGEQRPPGGDSKGPFVEQILRRCVPVESIWSLVGRQP